MNLSELNEKIEGSSLDSETREDVLDILAFVQGIAEAFALNGFVNPQEIDLAALEGAMDRLYGELGAATIFLSDKHFTGVPKMLRVIQTNMENLSELPVPPVVVKGFGRLAQRVEATRAAQQAEPKEENPTP